MSDLPIWAQIVIALVGGGTVGGVLGAFSPLFTAQLTYRQKMAETYRANVRAHIETLYKPLNVTLSHLIDHGNKFKDVDPPLTYEGQVQVWANYTAGCEKHMLEIFSLFQDGKDVYLTIQIEKKIRELSALIARVKPDSHMKGEIQKIEGKIYAVKLAIKYITLGEKYI
jgi:hypothetical protein